MKKNSNNLLTEFRDISWLIGIIFYIDDFETEVFFKDIAHLPMLLESQSHFVSCAGPKVPRAEEVDMCRTAQETGLL